MSARRSSAGPPPEERGTVPRRGRPAAAPSARARGDRARARFRRTALTIARRGRRPTSWRPTSSRPKWTRRRASRCRQNCGNARSSCERTSMARSEAARPSAVSHTSVVTTARRGTSAPGTSRPSAPGNMAFPDPTTTSRTPSANPRGTPPARQPAPGVARLARSGVPTPR